MNTKCYVKFDGNIVEAKYIGTFQHSQVIDASPLRGGHPGGVIAYPVVIAIVNDEFMTFKISDVSFTKPEESEQQTNQNLELL